MAVEPYQVNQQQKERRRTVPMNDLDFNLMTTESEWGKDGISEDLKEKLSRVQGLVDEKGDMLRDKDGKPLVDKESLWGLLGFYTRDMRLANLNKEELLYCQHYLDLSNDFLQVDLIRPFLISLSRVATILELSQSKAGFLRRRMHTFTSEHYSNENEPSKKSLFGMGNNQKKNR